MGDSSLCDPSGRYKNTMYHSEFGQCLARYHFRGKVAGSEIRVALRPLPFWPTYTGSLRC